MVSLLLIFVGVCIFYTIVESIETGIKSKKLTSPEPSNHRSNNEENKKIIDDYCQQIVEPFLNSFESLRLWI
jgi:hypothetical protein